MARGRRNRMISGGRGVEEMTLSPWKEGEVGQWERRKEERDNEFCNEEHKNIGSDKATIVIRKRK